MRPRDAIEWTVPILGLTAGVILLVSLRTPSPELHSEPAATPESLGSLTGIVLDAHGDPIPGARVSVLGEEGETLAETIASTDSSGALGLGEFRLDQLPGGTYALRADVPQSRIASGIARVPVTAWQDTRVRLRVDLDY